jgi:aspartate dehydrogenase
MTKSVLLIGCGAIGREIIEKLATETEICINQILVRSGKKARVSHEISGDIQIISSINEVQPVPDFVMECASHQAVAEFGPYFLSQGIDFGIISIGALSDPNLLKQLEVAAKNGGSQLVIVPGAIGGIDSLAAAGVANLEEVIYTSRKPPLSWKGSPADKSYDLTKIEKPTIIFQGSAGVAAQLYPKNANVAATIALAGLGFDQTQVTLVADPEVDNNTHQFEARGSFGELNVTISGNPLPRNLKSSALTAYSAVRVIKNRAQRVCI